MENEKLEKLAKAYFKLRGFLRVIPAIDDSEYGIIPKENKFFDAHRDGIRGDGESPRCQYRHTRNEKGEPIIILWEMLENYPFPTFSEFIKAFGGNSQKVEKPYFAAHYLRNKGFLVIAREFENRGTICLKK